MFCDFICVTFFYLFFIYIKINDEAKKNESIEKEVFKYLNELENGNDIVRNEFKSITDICVEGQKRIFDKMDIHWDTFTHESDFVFGHITKTILDKINEKGRLKEDENGRLYVDLTGYNIPTKTPVLVLTREDKTSLYPLRDIAYKALLVRDRLVKDNNQEPTMSQIAKELDIPREEVVFALDAIQDPVSLFEPIYHDGGDAIYVMDQISDSKNIDDSWLENISIREAMKKLNNREKLILTLRFFNGKTQMEVADEIGISQAQVSRLEKSAIVHIRRIYK